MSVRLEVATEIAAPIDRVWDELVDWAGQSRWIPFTTVDITTPSTEGLGVRAAALSGFRLGRLPVGLLDRFVVVGWTPPSIAGAELEVLHLGPYFTGPGVFSLSQRGAEPSAGGDDPPAPPREGPRTRVSAVELFDLTGGRLLEPPVRLLRPLMRAGFGVSLRRFAAVCER